MYELLKKLRDLINKIDINKIKKLTKVKTIKSKSINNNLCI